MKHFHCPVNAVDCPYYAEDLNHHCLCTMSNPYEECEDFAYSYGEKCPPEDYTDDH